MMKLFDEPDYVREKFRPSTDCGGEDGEGRSMRYLEWVWDPDPGDTTCSVDYACVLHEGEGSARLVLDRHIEGLFSRAEWLRFLSEAGFRAEAIAFEHSEIEPGTLEVFVARKP